MPFNINDQVQQKAFKSETARLWNVSQSFDSFEFHTIEDVLQELDECQNTVDKDIAELKKEVKQLNLEVDGHKVLKYAFKFFSEMKFSIWLNLNRLKLM